MIPSDQPGTDTVRFGNAQTRPGSIPGRHARRIPSLARRNLHPDADAEDRPSRSPKSRIASLNPRAHFIDTVAKMPQTPGTAEPGPAQPISDLRRSRPRRNTRRPRNVQTDWPSRSHSIVWTHMGLSAVNGVQRFAAQSVDGIRLINLHRPSTPTSRPSTAAERSGRRCPSPALR